MTTENVKEMIAGIIGGNEAITMPQRSNGIQLEWNSKDWVKVEDVIISLEKKLKKTGYVLRKARSCAIVLPASKMDLLAPDQKGNNAKRW